MRANFGRTTIALAGGLILAALTVGHELIAQCQVEPGSEIANDAAASNSSLRLREGTQLTEVFGQFRLTGDRASFIPADGSGKYLALENLTLDRVTQTISEDPNPLEWVISGTITEYKGCNYLLLSRAILKNKSPAAKPGLFGANR
jgi:hypothetical protein